MTTAVDICSNALGMLGDRGISSFDETTPRAIQCRTLYPTVRDFVLRSHPWNCATKRAIIDADPAPPAFDWSHSFALPGDWLRTLSAGTLNCPTDYAQEGRRLLANVAVLRLRYIARVPEAQWDSMLVHAVTVAMRHTLAYPITASTSLEEVIRQGLAGILQQARAVDGQENPPEMLGDELLYRAGF